VSERLPGALWRYGCALGATAIATVAALLLTGWVGLAGMGLLAFPIAVLVGAWVGGMGPGIVAALVSAVAVAFFFLAPVGSLSVETPRERIALAGFVMACLIESTLIGLSRRSERGLGRLAETVAQSEEKYRLLFERNPDPMWIFDANTHAILAANTAALAAYGYTAEEIEGLKVESLFEPGEAERFFGGSAGAGDGLWRHRSRSGAKLEVEIRTTSARWVGGMTRLMVVRDVTARKRAERALIATGEDLRRAKEAAERATHARDRFLVLLSHELRTPLTPALLAATALEARPGLPDDVRRAMAVISAKVKLEARLIDDLLDVVHILHGDFTVSRVPADARAVVGRAVESCLADARCKGVALTQELGDAAPIVSADPCRLQQAAASLIANAIDAAPEGSTVHVWMRDEPPGEVAIGCRHVGKGVATDRMFDPFERTTTPGSPNAWGLGLELVIGKAIAEASGGGMETTFDGEATSLLMHLPCERHARP
jgi:PAS domain S-box-containing protein